MIAVALAVVATLVGANAYFVYRIQPAGSLHVAADRLRYDAWRGGAVDVPLSSVRKAVIEHYANKGMSNLTIWMDSGRIHVHEQRLEAGTLEEVLSALVGEMEEGQRARVVAASHATVESISKTTRSAARVASIAGGVGAVLAVLLLLIQIVRPR